MPRTTQDPDFEDRFFAAIKQQIEQQFKRPFQNCEELVLHVKDLEMNDDKIKLNVDWRAVDEQLAQEGYEDKAYCYKYYKDVVTGKYLEAWTAKEK